MEFCDHIPLESKELYFLNWVMSLSFGQSLAGKGDDDNSPIIMCQVEDGPEVRSACIGV